MRDGLASDCQRSHDGIFRLAFPVYGSPLWREHRKDVCLGLADRFGWCNEFVNRTCLVKSIAAMAPLNAVTLIRAAWRA